jgi:hypothetical protein
MTCTITEYFISAIIQNSKGIKEHYLQELLPTRIPNYGGSHRFKMKLQETF